MGEFKGMGAEVEPLSDEEIRQATLLADGQPADFSENGGVAVTPAGEVIEVRNVVWASDDPKDLSGRATRLSIRQEEDGELVWQAPRYFDPRQPTMGAEPETSVTHNGVPFPVLPDGETLHYPDGSTEGRREWDKQPELLAFMVESDTGIAYGYEEMRHNNIIGAATTERWLENHDLQATNLTVYPYEFDADDINRLPYIQILAQGMDQPNALGHGPNLSEFGAMSRQLSIQMLSPEAGQHAINDYQEIQALTSLILQAAPMRDGRFDTTIGQHYHVDDETGSRADNGLYPSSLAPDDFLRRYGDHVPQDWRELSRLGSAIGGALPEALPVNTKDVLLGAHTPLQDGSIPSSERWPGWHTDRLKPGRGIVETCNPGTAGGNLYKQNASDEFISKYIVAKQMDYAHMSETERAELQETYKAKVETGHVNNIFIALSGKETKLATAAGGALTPAEMLTDTINYIDATAERFDFPKLSPDAKAELFATLETDETEYGSADEVFDAFFAPRSRMTATEALRKANDLRPEDMDEAGLLMLFSEKARQHVYKVEAELKDEQVAELQGEQRRIGDLVIKKVLSA